MGMRTVLTKVFRCLILSLIVSGLSFCSHFKAAEKTIATTPETRKHGTVDPSYVIGPRDVLEIQVWKEPDFSRQALVRPDGKITLPLMGDIQASGMNGMDLKDLLTEKLKSFVDNPEVTVIVLESHSKNFYILGRVNRPGTYPLGQDMTVLQALSVAGGLGEWADKDSIRIIRRSGGREEILRFDYDKVTSGKKLEQNILLEPNDTIIVP
jgi:polysaccharide export outer membrane protein